MDAKSLRQVALQRRLRFLRDIQQGLALDA